MITIGTSRIEEKGETAFLRAPVEVSPDTAREYVRRVSDLTNAGWLVREDYPPRAWSAGGGELWFSVPAEFGRYLCTERSNAFVVAMLWYALVAGSDITFEAPLSKRLYSAPPRTHTCSCNASRHKRLHKKPHLQIPDSFLCQRFGARF